MEPRLDEFPLVSSHEALGDGTLDASEARLDLAPHVGVDPARLEADTRAARGTRPFVMASLRDGAGVAEIVAFIEDAGGLG